MTVLSVVQDASVKIGIARPTQLIAATTREMYDARSILAEATDAILEAYDWQILKGIATITGDGVTTGWPLPAGYERMLADGSVWSSRYLWAMSHITDSDTWLQMLTQPITQVNGTWHLYANQFNFLPIMASGDTAKYFWISDLIWASSGGTPQSTFLADTDVFRLDEELLRLCFIWRWKNEKGRDYAEDLSNYEIKLSKMMSKDGGGKPVVSGSFYRSWRGRNVAFPGTVVP